MIDAATRAGLAAEQHPRQVDRVAADVEQRSAAVRRGCCGCCAGSSLKYENQLWTALSRPIRPDATSSHGRHPRRMVAVHERLHEHGRRRPRRPSTIRSRVGGRHGQRLLAQDVLAGPSRGDRPLGVEVVRQRDVDRVDVGVGEERLVRAVGASGCRAARRRRVPGPRRATRSPRPRSGRPCACPGITFRRAMSAVDRMPQRSASVIVRSVRTVRLLDMDRVVVRVSHNI